MRPSEYLRSLNDEDWQATIDHAFCYELAAGTLPVNKMKWYLTQDYMFVDGFVRLLASAIAHAPTLADSVPAAQFLALITGKENTYFLRSFEMLGVVEADWNAPPAHATAQFQGLMRQAVSSGKYEQMMAVLVVAEWSYLEWATPFNPPTEDLPFWFSEWITLHAGDGFAEVVEYLRGQLDDIWPTLETSAQADVEAIFKSAVTFERAFFDAAYTDRTA